MPLIMKRRVKNGAKAFGQSNTSVAPEHILDVIRRKVFLISSSSSSFYLPLRITNFKLLQYVVRRGDLRKPPGL